MPSGMVLDVAKYLGSLQYNVWKKMLDIITAGEVLSPRQRVVVSGLKRPLRGAALGVVGAGEKRSTEQPCPRLMGLGKGIGEHKGCSGALAPQK